MIDIYKASLITVGFSASVLAGLRFYSDFQKYQRFVADHYTSTFIVDPANRHVPSFLSWELDNLGIYNN